MKATIRVAISGATGRVAHALLPRIAAGEMFGPEHPVALSLLDIAEVLPVLTTVAAEIKAHPTPLLSEVHHGTDARRAFEGAEWVVLLGGMRWRADLTDVEWARLNGSVFVAQSRALNAVAPTARVLVGVHPCNVQAMIARSHAQDVPQEHWFALTRHAELHAADLIAAKAGVPRSKVQRLSVWGNDGPRLFVDVNNAWIDDQPANRILDDHWLRSVFEPELTRRVLDVFQTRGDAPVVASQAIVETIRGLTTPTPYRHWLSAGVVSDGSYGVNHGLNFSFPIRTENGQTWSIVQGLYLDAHAQDRIAANVAEMNLDAVGMGELIT